MRGRRFDPAPAHPNSTTTGRHAISVAPRSRPRPTREAGRHTGRRAVCATPRGRSYERSATAGALARAVPGLAGGQREVLGDDGVLGLGLVVVVEEQRSALTREDARDPGVAVGDAPDGVGHAALHEEAGLHRLVPVGLLRVGVQGRQRLAGERAGRGARLDGGADVDLGLGDVQAQVGEALHGGLQVREAVLGAQVGLEAHAVDRHLLRLELLHQVVDGLALGPGVLDVVVVVEQLGRGVGLVGPAEGVGDVVGAVAPRLIEDRLPRRAVLVEGLVHHVPGPDAALVAAGLCLDVLLDGVLDLLVGQRGRRPAVGGYPRRQLAVPDQGVAAHELAVRLRALDDLVGAGEVEDALLGLHDLPLHDVLRRDRVELAVHDLGVGGVLTEEAGVDGRPDAEAGAGGEGAQRPLDDGARRAGCRGGLGLRLGGVGRGGGEGGGLGGEDRGQADRPDDQRTTNAHDMLLCTGDARSPARFARHRAPRTTGTG